MNREENKVLRSNYPKNLEVNLWCYCCLDLDWTTIGKALLNESHFNFLKNIFFQTIEYYNIPGQLSNSIWLLESS